jgi:two-component system, NarL family, sensor histidine kinase DesK
MTRPVTAPASESLPGRLRQNVRVWARTARRRASTAADDGPDGCTRAGPVIPADCDDRGLLRGPAPRLRLTIIGVIVAYFVLDPAAGNLGHDPTARNALLLAGALAFIGLLAWLVTSTHVVAPQRVPWPLLAVILALGIALYLAEGRENWLIVLVLAAAACGRFSATARPAVTGAVTCGAAGLALAVADHYTSGNLALAALTPSLGAFFAYLAGKRLEALATLRQTRAELARVAVAEERLRIARDLHDLLGHSLSLITLKAELSRRMIAADTAGAEREIAELEAVARQSLSDVREAVAGYRQPDLAAELGAARQLLAAAGVTCRISVPPDLSLPAEVDTLLAWAVREGVTNVVRHARATSAAITIASGRDGIAAEISDNGRGGARPAGTAAPGSGPGPEPAPRTGSGLAGLGERVRRLGGRLEAGPAGPAGFRLRITIPASPRPAPGRASGEPAAGAAATPVTGPAAEPATPSGATREPAR